MRCVKVGFFVCAISSLFAICGYASCSPNQGNIGAGLAGARFKDVDQMSRTFQAPVSTKMYPEFSSVPQIYQGYMIPGTFQSKVPNREPSPFRK